MHALSKARSREEGAALDADAHQLFNSAIIASG
jgi:hypothetical protein